jgi:putative two-component system response regulator
MNGKILVVDDDADNRNLMGEFLGSHGYETIMAGDGQTALDQFSQSEPDLVLLDVIMPSIGGLEVCSRLKADPASRLTPVVLVTGLSATEDRIRGLEVGADDFLTKPLDQSELLARVRSLLSLKSYTDELERVEGVIFAMSRIVEGKDPYTVGHCERLSAYSVRLAHRIGLSADQTTSLERAGIVHDIGKIAVPDSVLLKAGPLTCDEWKIMREHPINGAHICMPLKSFRCVHPIIRHHHEKLDGSGYPDGIKGSEIPLTARVLQIVDVYDALTTERPYKRALSVNQSFEIMEAEVKKGWWDPDVFKEFRDMVSEPLCGKGESRPEPHRAGHYEPRRQRTGDHAAPRKIGHRDGQPKPSLDRKLSCLVDDEEPVGIYAMNLVGRDLS